MDPFEALAKKETDSAEKHQAAAEFFTGLKTAGAKLKVRQVARDKTKELISQQQGKSVSLKPLPQPDIKPKGGAKGGVGQLAKLKKLQVKKVPVTTAKKDALPKIKIPKNKKLPKVKTASPEDKKAALIEALRMEKTAMKPFTWLGRHAAPKAKGAVDEAAKFVGSGIDDASSYTKGMMDATPATPSYFRQAWNLTKGGVGGAARATGRGVAGVAEAVAPGSGAYLRETGRTLAESGKKLKTQISNTAKGAEWNAVNKRAYEHALAKMKTPKPTDATELAEWTKKLKGHQDQYMAGVAGRKGGSAVSGVPVLMGDIGRAIRDPDGKISPSSIYKGLEGLGLTNPEHLMGLGVGGVGAIRAAQASKAAAKKHNQMLMLGGGAAGLGAFGLIRANKKSKQPQPMPVRMV